MKPSCKLEEGNLLTLDWDKLAKASVCPGMIPVVVQHAGTREVLLLAYTNEIAFRKSVQSRTLVLWSTSRNELWEKGKTSGETFELLDVRVNCEQNSLLYLVRPKRGGICHTRNRDGSPRNCFYRRLNLETGDLENLDF